jgi:hypothetical protein
METTTTKGKLPPKVANMVFEYILLLICSEQLTVEVLDNILFWIFWILYVWIRFKISLIFNFQIMRKIMGATRRNVFG